MERKIQEATEQAADYIFFAGCLIAIKNMLHIGRIKFLESEAGQKYKTLSTLKAAGWEEDDFAFEFVQREPVPYEWARVVWEIREFIGNPIKDAEDMLNALHHEAKLSDAGDVLERMTAL